MSNEVLRRIVKMNLDLWKEIQSMIPDTDEDLQVEDGQLSEEEIESGDAENQQDDGGEGEPEPWAKGHRCGVQIDDEVYYGEIVSIRGEKATILFDDGDKQSHPLDDLQDEPEGEGEGDSDGGSGDGLPEFNENELHESIVKFLNGKDYPEMCKNPDEFRAELKDWDPDTDWDGMEDNEVITAYVQDMLPNFLADDDSLAEMEMFYRHDKKPYCCGHELEEDEDGNYICKVCDKDHTKEAAPKKTKTTKKSTKTTKKTTKKKSSTKKTTKKKGSRKK